MNNKKPIAVSQVPDLEFAQLLAKRYNGWVEGKIVHDKQLYVVYMLR